MNSNSSRIERKKIVNFGSLKKVIGAHVVHYQINFARFAYVNIFEFGPRDIATEGISPTPLA